MDRYIAYAEASRDVRITFRPREKLYYLLWSDGKKTSPPLDKDLQMIVCYRLLCDCPHVYSGENNFNMLL